MGNRKYIKDTSDAIVVEYTYNEKDQLESKTAGGSTITYVYDENGLLCKKVYGSDPQTDPYDEYQYNLLF